MKYLIKILILTLLLTQISFGALAKNFLLEDTLGRKIEGATLQKLTGENIVIFFHAARRYELPLERFSEDTKERILIAYEINKSGLKHSPNLENVQIFDLTDTHVQFYYGKKSYKLPKKALPTEVIESAQNAYNLRAQKLKDLNTVFLEENTDSDQKFDLWVLKWYEENFFRHPNMPLEIVEVLLQDPGLRIEYFDVFKRPEEVRYNYHKFELNPLWKNTNIRYDSNFGVIKALKEIYDSYSKEVLENIRLSLALSLIYDIPKEQFMLLGFHHNSDLSKRRTSIKKVFKWKLENNNEFLFKNEELGIRELTWTNTTNQKPEALDWAITEGFNYNLDELYTRLTHRDDSAKNTSKYPSDMDIRKYKSGVCVQQSFILTQRFIAFNLPHANCFGEGNTLVGLPHVYTKVKLPNNTFEYGGRWGRDGGVILEPTTLTFHYQSMFDIYLSDEYNTPLRQKIRAKVQYVQSLEDSEKESVLNDILSELEHGEALAMRKILTGLDPPRIGTSLDRALYLQHMVWHYIEINDPDKAKEMFEGFISVHHDEDIRLAWAFGTLRAIEAIEPKRPLYPVLASIGPTSPGSIGGFIQNTSNVDQEEVKVIVRSVHKAHDRKNFRDFDKILLHTSR